MMYPICHLWGSNFTKISISPNWTVASCSKCTNPGNRVPCVRKCKNFSAGIPARYCTILNQNSIFFDNFVQFLSKTAAEISRSLVMVALRNYITNVTFLRSTKSNLFWATLTTRDFDLSQAHYFSVPILS